jgi:hypothetical protein
VIREKNKWAKKRGWKNIGGRFRVQVYVMETNEELDVARRA